MALVKFAFLVAVLIGNSVASKPAVRLRVTQKGLDYAMEMALTLIERQLLTTPIPDRKGHLKLLNCDYAITGISITKVNIPLTSTTPIPRKGLRHIARNVDVDLKGKWKYTSWLSFNGDFRIEIKGLSVGILIKMLSNNSRLVVSNVTCASIVKNVNIIVTGPSSWLFQPFKNYLNGRLKTKITKMVCKNAKTKIKKELNKRFSSLPVKLELQNSVTLDYSVVQNPVFRTDSMDMFLKGEFQPSNDSKVWVHQPRSLPFDPRRNRMMYLTITDHMANSAGHAFYNRGVLKVDLSEQQAHVMNKIYFTTNGFRSLPSTFGLSLVHLACPNCNLHIKMEATSPPRFKTNNTGIHIELQGIANVNAVFPDNSSRTVLALVVNATATATPKLNGTTLIPAVDNLRVTTRILQPTVVTATPERIKFLDGFVEREVKNLLKNRFSAYRIPLPVLSKLKLVKPIITYGQRYATLESDIELI